MAGVVRRVSLYAKCQKQRPVLFAHIKPARKPTVYKFCSQSNSTGGNGSQNPIIQYFRRLKWVPIPLAVGFAYISYQQFGHVQEREKRRIQATHDPEDLLVKDWVVTLYKFLPLKALSCAWGALNSKELPMWLRAPVYKAYIWCFNCHLEEAAIRDLKHYRNLSEFFRRRLRPDVRKQDQNHSVTSPSDGSVLYFGKACDGQVEQVKGIKYSLREFLGPPDWLNLPDKGQKENTHAPIRNKKYHSKLKQNPENDLYHCIIYLAPGDYHGFHSPTEWSVDFRRHFPGELFSVNPGVARLVRGLFCLNERVVYCGKWKHGFFSMVAVGATNVGSIKIGFDQELACGACQKYPPGTYLDRTFDKSPSASSDGIGFKRGDHFGEFNLGSTIVLVFEAPADFEFNIEPGQKIKLGQAIGSSKRKSIENQS